MQREHNSHLCHSLDIKVYAN